MAENPIEATEATEPQVEKKSRFKSFTVNHPRTAKVVGYAAVAGATIVALTVYRNRKQNVDSTEAGDPNASSEPSSETA